MSSNIVTRTAETKDIPFLLQLRRQTMNIWLEKSDMSTSNENHMKRIELGFDAAQIVQIDGDDVDLLKCVHAERDWELVQIQLVPALQGSGIGTLLIEQLLAEAREAEASVRLSVLKVSPARKLYERLGFVVTDESEKMFNMVCLPSP